MRTWDDEFGEAVAGIIKSFLKAMPGDATVDELLLSIIATPTEDMGKFVAAARKTFEKSHVRKIRDAA